MYNDEVIVSGFGAGVLARGKFTGLTTDALDSSDVLQSFILCHVAAGAVRP